MNRCAHCYGDLPDFAVFCPHCAHADEPDLQQLLHQTIAGRYKLYRRLGQGGLSTVFAAADLRTDSVVVVKVSDPAQLVQRELSYAIDAEAARNYWGEMLERMRREAETLAAIHHPNLVRFYDTGLIGADLRFVVMEFLRGRTLRDELDAKGKLDPATAVRIALEICQALREVHARGIVHRDLSPRNVMLCNEVEAKGKKGEGGKGGNGEWEKVGNGNEETQILPISPSPRLPVSPSPSLPFPPSPHPRVSTSPSPSQVKLIDFGIAKFPQPPGAPPFTQHSVLSGTVAYASPEQCQSREVDARSDVYALGVVLYEMVTGQKPFSGRTPTEVALKQIQEEPIPPRQLNAELPANLERAILRALAKDPARRQQSAEQFAEELQSGGQTLVPLHAMQPAEAAEMDGDGEALAQRLRVMRRRRRRVALATAALLLVGATTGILLGKDWLASRLVESPLVSLANFGAQPSPTPNTNPNDLNSDPDALELAAQLPADAAANPGVNKSAQPSPAINSTPNTQTPLQPTPLPSAAKPAESPAPTPVIAETPATPAPTVAVLRTPPPVNPPPANKSETAQAPSKAEDRFDPRADKHGQNGASTEDGYHNDSPQTARRDRVANTRRRDEDDSRRESNSRKQEPPAEDDPQDREDARQLGPKLIQWSGSVNREREIVIELPGKPGRLEIPRVYRNRVGLVEPPSPSNRWRCAKLRVIGQGGISFVVRWWPEIIGLSRLGDH